MSDQLLRWPWGEGSPDPDVVYVLRIDTISLPDLRVTSTFTPEQTAELVGSLQSEGQKDPIKCVWTDQRVVLADGLNRILGLKSLGVDVVKSLVTPGTLRDVQIANIITARHRGRENPGQTADVIKDLAENEKMAPGEIRQRLGISEGTFRRLFSISKLPEEVKAHLKFGRLGVLAAYHISQLGDPTQEITLAQQAVDWKYTEDQVKAAVIQLLNPDAGPGQTQYLFEASGRPQPVYPRCACCDAELQAVALSRLFCPACYDLVGEFVQAYNSQSLTPAPAAPDPPRPATSEPGSSG